MTVFDALALSQGVRRGEVQLLGKVVYHRQQNTVSLHWQPLTGESPSACLARCRLRLKRALQARLKAMEESPYWTLSPEEYEQFCAKYGRYAQLLEAAPSADEPEQA